jgi:curved DNA-binding protein CbpA
MLPHEEDVDIDAELRTYVTDTCAHLDSLDHYALLGVARGADARTIKRAYHRLAGLLHPDRFFRKRLGSYKAGLLQLFTRVTIAHDTLTSPGPRAEYDATLGIAGPPAARKEAPSPSPRPPPRSPEASAAGARQAAMDALTARFHEAKAKARQRAEAGERAQAAGDLVSAANAYREALRLTPGDAALKAALDAVERSTATRVVETRRKQALLEERYGHWEAAAASWQKVLEGARGDGEATHRLAAALDRVRTAGR